MNEVLPLCGLCVPPQSLSLFHDPWWHIFWFLLSDGCMNIKLWFHKVTCWSRQTVIPGLLHWDNWSHHYLMHTKSSHSLIRTLLCLVLLYWYFKWAITESIKGTRSWFLNFHLWSFTVQSSTAGGRVGYIWKYWFWSEENYLRPVGIIKQSF